MTRALKVNNGVEKSLNFLIKLVNPTHIINIKIDAFVTKSRFLKNNIAILKKWRFIFGLHPLVGDVTDHRLGTNEWTAQRTID